MELFSDDFLRTSDIIFLYFICNRDLHFLFSFITDFCSQTKVRDLQFHAVVKEHVSQLKVSVYDVMGVDILHPFHQLSHVVPNLILS